MSLLLGFVPCVLAPVQETTWAASATVASSDGMVDQPVGDACNECWEVGRVLLGFKTFQEYAKAVEDADEDSELRATIKEIQGNLAAGKTMSTGKTGEYVCVDSEYEVSTAKTYRGYSDASLRRRVGCTRLSQRMVAGVPELSCPDLDDGSAEKMMWLFRHEGAYDMADDGQDITVVARKKFKLGTVLLPASDNLWPGHASSTMARGLREDATTACFRNLLGKPTMDLNEWVAEQLKHKKAMGNGTGTAAGGVKATLSGKAANELEVHTGENEVADPSLTEDLTDLLVVSGKAKEKQSAVGTPSKFSPGSGFQSPTGSVHSKSIAPGEADEGEDEENWTEDGTGEPTTKQMSRTFSRRCVVNPCLSEVGLLFLGKRLCLGWGERGGVGEGLSGRTGGWSRLGVCRGMPVPQATMWLRGVAG